MKVGHSGPAMRIETLTPETARAWFDAEDAGTSKSSAPDEGAAERLGALIAGAPLGPHLRLVATGPDGPFGRFAAEARELAIRFWHPSFRAGTPPGAAAEARRRFLDELIARRREAGLARLPIETRPGDDLPDNADWLAALGTAGFVETCAYQLYILDAKRFPRAPRAAPGLIISETAQADRARIAALFAAAYDDGLDRREREPAEPRAHIDTIAGIGEGHDPRFWLCGAVDGAPAAFVLVNRARVPEFEGTSAWLLEIGCLPAYRNRGIARALLGEALHRLRATDCRRILATIDDQNEPSIGLHRGFGFRPAPDRHYVFRLPSGE